MKWWSKNPHDCLYGCDQPLRSEETKCHCGEEEKKFTKCSENDVKPETNWLISAEFYSKEKGKTKTVLRQTKRMAIF